MEVGGLWEAAKHSQFEAALKAHPRVAGEPGELRWQRIAAMVSGASAAECQGSLCYRKAKGENSSTSQ